MSFQRSPCMISAKQRTSKMSLVRVSIGKNSKDRPVFLERVCNSTVVISGYINKCIQLYQTTVVRHGLMLVGPPASGKTKVQYLPKVPIVQRFVGLNSSQFGHLTTVNLYFIGILLDQHKVVNNCEIQGKQMVQIFFRYNLEHLCVTENKSAPYFCFLMKSKYFENHLCYSFHFRFPVLCFVCYTKRPIKYMYASGSNVTKWGKVQ